MLYYKSSIGCVEYYDDVDHEPRLCDPTMMFILGLEAVTTPQEEYYKEVSVIDQDTHKPIIDPDTGLPVTETVVDGIRLRHIVIYKDRVNNEDVYNKIIKYFSIHGKIEEFEDRVEFYCAGLRQFMNQLTGTDSSRIVPVIFHDIIEFSTLGVENDSDYNEIYEKITGVLNNAGCKNQTYKRLDIKSMYSYALGVLFGCFCLGYDKSLVFTVDPSHWYSGEYSSLTSSAYAVFKFHHYHDLCCIDIDRKLKRKYHSAQSNKIWNFSDSGMDVDSLSYYCRAIKEDDSFDIIYFISGTYIKYDDESGEWSNKKSIGELIDSGYGIIDLDSATSYYIGQNNIEIFRSCKSSRNSYLSPNGYSHYTDVADIHWLNFIQRKSDLSLSPVSISELDQGKFNNAIRKLDGAVIGYYKAVVADNITVYCTLDSRLSRSEDRWSFVDVEDTFSNILSSEEFDDLYYYSEDIFNPDRDVIPLWNDGDVMWLYLSPNRNNNMNIPVIDGIAHTASLTTYGYSWSGNISSYMEAKFSGTRGNNLSAYISWLDSWSGRAGYQFTVYEGNTVVYASPIRIGPSEAINEYIRFDSVPSISGWYSGMGFRFYLSGGTDEDTVGVPIYYEDGTRVESNPYIMYTITEILQKEYFYYGTSRLTSDLVGVQASDFNFVEDEDGYLLLQYTGQRDIKGLTGFSFRCESHRH